MSGDPQVEFLFVKYFNLGDPFFVMYNVFREFHLISPTAPVIIHDKERIRRCKVFFAEKMAEIGAG